MTECVDVVIVTFQSASHLAAAATSLRDASNVASVTVVDNGSTDGTAQQARCLNWGVEAHVIENPRNLGFGVAVNLGVRANDDPSRYLLLLNPDATLEASGLERLIGDLDADPSLACVGAQLRRPTGEDVSSARDFPTVASILRRRPEDAAHSGCLVRADWICGALMLWRREAFENLNGFSAKYFLYYEDTDLCRRAQSAGWAVAVDGGVVACHDQGHGRRTPAHLRRHNRRSRRRYASQWLGWRGVVAASVADVVEGAGSMLRMVGWRR